MYLELETIPSINLNKTEKIKELKPALWETNIDCEAKRAKIFFIFMLHN